MVSQMFECLQSQMVGVEEAKTKINWKKSKAQIENMYSRRFSIDSFGIATIFMQSD